MSNGGSVIGTPKLGRGRSNGITSRVTIEEQDGFGEARAEPVVGVKKKKVRFSKKILEPACKGVERERLAAKIKRKKKKKKKKKRRGRREKKGLHGHVE